MSVALESARLFDETNRLLEETRQRNAELAVINSVQQGLASQLEIQAVFDLVGDKVREIFDAQIVSIVTYDKVKNLNFFPYIIERGERLHAEPTAPYGFAGHILKSRKSLMINENLAERAPEFGAGVLVGEPIKSYVGVPLMVANEAKGVITLQNIDREHAFSDSDLRLLTTLASSMSVALESARLFDETNRLLEETRQRNAELAVINSIQEGLASQLEMQAVFDLVGEKVREIFDAQIVQIVTYDPQANLAHWRYVIERGERLTIVPRPPIGFSGHILRSHQALMINADMEERAAEYGSATIAGEDIKSYLGVPLMIGNEAKGVIALQNIDHENAFSDSDLRLLTTLASSMSVALENARLFDETNRLLDETRQRAAELSIINSVGQGLVKQLEFQAVIDLVGDKIGEIFSADTTYIALYDPKTGMGHMRYYVDRGQRKLFEPIPLDDSTGLTGHIIRTREALLLGTSEETEEYDVIRIPSTDDQEDDLNESFLGVPFFSGDQAVGVVSVQSYQKHAYDEGDLRLLSTLATSMSVALENARLFEETTRLLEETRQRNAEMAVINSIQQGLASQLDMQAVFDLVGNKIREIFDAQAVTIYTYDRETDLVHYPYLIERGQRYFVEPSPPGGFGAVVLRERRPLLFNENVAERMVEFGSELLAGEPSKSFLAVPLAIGEQAIGGISLENVDHENAFSEADVRLLGTIASSMSVALENARLFEETRRLLDESRKHNAELAAISTVSQALVAETELDKLIRLVGDQVRETFDADIAYVALYDPRTNMIDFPYLYGEDEVQSMPFGSGLTSEIIRSGQPLLLNRDIDAAAAEMNTQRQGIRASSYLGVPITVGRQKIGAVSVQSTHKEDRFDEADLRLLSTIAANMGVAIRNAQLYSETQRRAEEMAALNEIGREASATLDLPTVLERITSSARQVLAAHTSAVILLEEDGQSLRPIAADGVMAKEVNAFTWKLGQGLVGNIVQSGAAEMINNTIADPRMIHLPGTEQSVEGEKLLVAPLISRDRAVGAIAAWRDPGDALFTQEDLNFVVGLSQQAAIAIQNARLFEETQRQKQYSEGLVLNSPVAIVTTDLEARVVSWNPAAERLFGYWAEEAIGRNIDELIATNDMREEAVDYTQQVWSEGRVNAVTRRSRKDGSLVDVELLALPVTVEGVNAGLIAIYHDITELKRAEQAMLQQKEYLEAVMLNTPVAIVTTDMRADIVSWNPAAEKLFGYPADEAIGQNIDELIARRSEEMQSEASAYNAQASQGRLHAITQRNRKDGTLVDVELLGVPVNIDGKQTGIIAIYHDITELKRAKEEAEAANEAKSAFLATMSHEIRTPMNAVIGMSGLLLDTQLNEEQHEFAEIIRNSGDALLAIINDILDFSKIEAGKMDLESQPFDLRECVEGTLDLVAGRAFEKGLDLAYVIEDGTPVGIIGDVTRLRQILLNLLTNAVKFTEQGEVVLSVRREGQATPAQGGDGGGPDRGRHTLHFTVRDTGIGIPLERMDRLFQSFSQVDASTARKYGGTGLGLVISKRLSEMMGGAMWAQSDSGIGTTFHFTIQTEATTAIAPASRRIKHSDPQLHDRRVLIVDDNETNRRILGLQVKGWGMQSHVTASPLTALEWIRRGDAFDVAILDMHMPEMDGLTLASEIRQHREASALPLILFTSLGRRETGAEELGFAAFLTKPIKPSQLFDALVAIFAEQPVAAQRQPSVPQRLDPEMAHRHPLRILLAEDNAVNQKLALRLLAQMGYRADVAANGLEAIDSLERQKYDVVLMDVQMPEMDGLEASRQINQRWSRGDRPQIVAMTANAMQGDRELCIAAGMDDYITKPIRVDELVGALDRIPAGRSEEGHA
jgi:PAS domain S-box-containing protein